VESSLGQDLQSWLDTHVHCFEFLGGVPEVVTPDLCRGRSYAEQGAHASSAEGVSSA